MNSMVGMGNRLSTRNDDGTNTVGNGSDDGVVYQISVMFGILGAVSLSVILLVQWGYRFLTKKISCFGVRVNEKFFHFYKIMKK